MTRDKLAQAIENVLRKERFGNEYPLFDFCREEDQESVFAEFEISEHEGVNGWKLDGFIDELAKEL